MADALDVALTVASAFERCDIGYFLGGSLASSIHGEPRATNDIDFVIDLAEAKVADLANALGREFEVDQEALRDAVRQKRSWNIYYIPWVTKIDLFILRDGAFDRAEFSRRTWIALRSQRLCVKSPEDSVLRKLRWFRDGGEVSSSQWRDVVEVLRVSSAQLDELYLDTWASSLGVVDLLERARREATATR